MSTYSKHNICDENKYSDKHDGRLDKLNRGFCSLFWIKIIGAMIEHLTKFEQVSMINII